MLVTGKQVLEAFKSDVEGFFYPDAGFVMNTAVNGIKTRYVGDAEKGGIAVSHDLAAFEVRSLADLMFVLLVLGHEAGHLLNVHGAHQDSSKDETRALEVWADFYGAKVAMAVMTIGTKVRAMVDSHGGTNAGVRLDAIGVALGRLSGTYFEVADRRYEPSPTRVATFVAGVMSGLVVNWVQHGHVPSVENLIHAQRRIYATEDMRAQLLLVQGSAPEQSQFSTIRHIHQKIQGDKSAITAGMKCVASEWIQTNYDGTDEEYMDRYVEALKQLKVELSAVGLDLPDA